MTLMHPTIHNNGSGAANLQAKYEAVWQALKEALEALALSRPNPRDYYVNPDADAEIKLAEEQHRAREKKVEAVQAEMMELIRRLGRIEMMKAYRLRQLELEKEERLKDPRDSDSSS